MLSLLCFVAGGLTGWGASRGGDRVQEAWPLILRAQILVTSATLSLVAAWRLTSPGQLVGPLLLTGGMWAMFLAAVATRGTRSTGEGALEAWGVGPNSGFWVVPAAAAFAGPAGTMIAVLANVFTTVWGAVCVHFMRRDAPHPQRRSTTWVDQSPLIASAVGFLMLWLIGSAPSWTNEFLTLAGPLLAFSGAALFAGSVAHPHNMKVPRSEHALRRVSWLAIVRVGYFLLIAVFATSTPLTIVAVLTALSAPSFQPVQLAVLYGYRSGVVNVAVRWGWVLAPFGLGAAALIR